MDHARERAAQSTLTQLRVLRILPLVNGIQKVATLFAPMKSRTLKEDIVELLTDAIISGKISPGQRLNESELSRMLQVSRAPIREALQQLHQQGLAMSHSRRGMYVVSLDDADLQKINSLRLILEAEALRLARSHLTTPQEKKLIQLVERMESAKSSPAIETVRFDLDFHRAIWRLSNNEYLEKTLTSLTAPLFAYAVLILPKAEKMRMILDSHRPLLNFVQGKSTMPAEQVMLEHLRLRWTNPASFSSLRSEGRRADPTGDRGARSSRRRRAGIR